MKLELSEREALAVWRRRRKWSEVRMARELATTEWTIRKGAISLHPSEHRKVQESLTNGEIIWVLRKRLKMTPEEFASIAGVTKMTVNNAERDRYDNWELLLLVIMLYDQEEKAA